MAEEIAPVQADVDALMDSKRMVADMQEKAGNITKAQELRARLGQDETEIRAQLGLPKLPATVEAAPGHASNPQPGDYKLDPTTLAHAGVSGERLDTSLTNLRDLGTAMKLAPEFGPAVLGRIPEVAVKFHAMNEAQRNIWLAEQEDVGLRMAGSEAQLKAWRTNAKAMLGVTAHGRNFADSPIAMDIFLVRTLWNLKTAKDQFASSKRK